jgi:hypothetical protein
VFNEGIDIDYAGNRSIANFSNGKLLYQPICWHLAIGIGIRKPTTLARSSIALQRNLSCESAGTSDATRIRLHNNPLALKSSAIWRVLSVERSATITISLVTPCGRRWHASRTDRRHLGRSCSSPRAGIRTTTCHFANFMHVPIDQFCDGQGSRFQRREKTRNRDDICGSQLCQGRFHHCCTRAVAHPTPERHIPRLHSADEPDQHFNIPQEARSRYLSILEDSAVRHDFAATVIETQKVKMDL